MLSKKSINSLLLLTGLLSAQNDFGYVSSDNLPEKRCGLPDASPAEVLQSMEDIDYWRASRNFRNTETHVLVAFHVIYNSNGTGNISTSSIQAAVDKLLKEELLKVEELRLVQAVIDQLRDEPLRRNKKKCVYNAML